MLWEMRGTTLPIVPMRRLLQKSPAAKLEYTTFFVSVHPRRCLGNAQNPAPELKSAAYPGAAKLRFVHLDEKKEILM